MTKIRSRVMSSKSPLRIALLFGGSSTERGISLNSARSVADHLDPSFTIIDVVIFFDSRNSPHEISPALLYCNTTSDFDFKLATEGGKSLSTEQLALRLQDVDLAFPVMHGEFGEDGQIQRLLESLGVHFVGTGSAACESAFDKYTMSASLRRHGVPTVPTQLFTRAQRSSLNDQTVIDTISTLGDKYIVKPARSGSSIDVHVASGRSHAVSLIDDLLSRYDRVVLQPYMDGIEFTTVVLAGIDGPVALLPIEIEMHERGEDTIFSFRDKYLASHSTQYHCPPRFDRGLIDRIQALSETVFNHLGLQDFARIDGWMAADGTIAISDVNPISGMEQTSFLFLQAAQLGMTHADVLYYVIDSALRRSGESPTEYASSRRELPRDERKPVAVLFGGGTAERQVSVTSGINVWLKLLRSKVYRPVPHLVTTTGEIWELSYPTALRHSVEEIMAACTEASELEAVRREYAGTISHRLGWQANVAVASLRSKAVEFSDIVGNYDFAFLALHGGTGEDGTWQRSLEQSHMAYNGSGPEASSLCMDKYETGRVVAGLGDHMLASAPRLLLSLGELTGDHLAAAWTRITATCGSPAIAKPIGDGCSAGVVPLADVNDLSQYVQAIRARMQKIDGAAFSLMQPGQIIEMPSEQAEALIFEQFIFTDDVAVVYETERESSSIGATAHLLWGNARSTGWIEVTTGVIGEAGKMHALNPSVAIAGNAVLSLEEKFMGGTGINITPPPSPPLGRVQADAVAAAKIGFERVANALGIDGYARIDAFMNIDSGRLIVIECNTLPGLTPATVLYHQALAEDKPLFPRELLEEIIRLGLERRSRLIVSDANGG